ncbi:MAG: DNA mismatch repair protein MutS [Lachnospiraceae bacterium]|nr:DNA mismatch repair protein MutS [Lachnospiraceae bacterium]
MNMEKQIEFDKIKGKWAALAVTGHAKEIINNMVFYLSESDLRRHLKDTTDSRDLIEKLGAPPLPDVEEIKEIVAAAGRGECLPPYQLERTEKVLVAVKRLKDYLRRGEMYRNHLAFYNENLEACDSLREEILSKIRGGAVDDYASKNLLQLRKQIAKTEEQMKLKAAQIMRKDKEYMADSYSTLRNGRLCVPVKKECKLKVQGTIIDKSATGNTFFIEPLSIAKYYEELQVLKINEENEVYQVLYTLSSMVAGVADIINANIEVIEKLDFIFSKGKLSIDLDATEPEINTGRSIILKDARHPLMDKNISVPLQFEMGGSTRGIVITGPNTGGKTIAIKTVMLNCIMAQCGLHVTCREASICMNSSYLCDIGDGQNLAENLSTFSAHIKNILQILEETNNESFIIMDELGSGTDPAEGMGIAIAVLEELKKKRCLFLVTTHYPEVKEYAERTQGIINARMAFDKETLCPVYKMIIGEAGESCAFYIAGKLGMPGSMLKTAICHAYGKDATSNYNIKEKENFTKQQKGNKVKKIKPKKDQNTLRNKYKRGDSVMVFPDKKTGIVCEPVNDKGVLRVQLPDRKIWINHKRVKLQVAATELYPEDYDFSIIFDTVENRKARHEMERKYTEKTIEYNS